MVTITETRRAIEIRPAAGGVSATGLLFYPGGLVDSRVYNKILASFAETAGVLSLVVIMPANLAVFDIDAGLSVNVVIMPGLILSRPDPFFLFAAELSAVAAWEISPRFSLAFIAGPRYTLSPGYTEAVSPLELLDLTLGFAAGFGLGE